VRIRRVPNVTKDTLTGFVLDLVAPHSEIRTDGWQGYFDIGKCRYPALRHDRLAQRRSRARGPAARAPRRFASKRWILGTHQGAVSHHQLDYYLDEVTFRFNRCTQPPRRCRGARNSGR
jgi:hypothetical protein